jgi:RNA polymerase sigma-70 factor (ECF subfamily)
MDKNTHAPEWIGKLFSSLYSRFGQNVLKFVLKRNGGDLEAAEEILQDTFVAAFKSFHTFRHKSSYFTWLCKIALNKLADYYREQVHATSKIVVPSLKQLNSLLDPSLSLEEKLSLDELRQSVNACLDLLPPEHRRLLHLKYYQQLSGKELCVKLQLTPRQLEGRLYRARHALAKVVSSLYPHLKL